MENPDRLQCKCAINEESKISYITSDRLHRDGFSSAFSSDPQGNIVSKVFTKGDIEIHQINEAEERFYIAIDYELFELKSETNI